MEFKGYGIIWNPKKSKPLCNFKENPVYKTSDPYEIEILSNSDHVTEVFGSVEVKETIIAVESDVSESKGMTKKEVMDSLDASGIDYNPRDKKEVLLSLLEG